MLYLWNKKTIMDRKIEISYKEFSGIGQMEAADRELVEAAVKATENSYAPYSNFHVGAAVRLASGRIITGANQENAAYPSGLCAERTAMFAAGANYPDDAQISIAIAAADANGFLEAPATPCGACRQVMAEYQKKGRRNMSVILFGTKAIWKFEKVDDILPLIFDSI